LIKEGKVVRGYLGVRIQPLTAAFAKELKLPDNRGALIFGVLPGGPADAGGLQKGDVIRKLGDKQVSDPSELRILTANLDVGAQVPVEYARGGAIRTATVKIAELPESPEAEVLGFHLKESPIQDGKGTILEVDRIVPDGPAAQAGVRPGMKVIGIGRQPVRSLTEFSAIISNVDLDRGLPLVILSGENQPRMIWIGGHGPGPGDGPAEEEGNRDGGQGQPGPRRR